MNFGTPVPLLIGIILIIGALALFFLDKIRPGYARDSDKVYAVLLMISGVFLLGHLNMELLASFQQLIMAGMLTTLIIESIRSRVPSTEPLRPVDNRPPRAPRYDDRPPSRRVYRAELDDRGVPLRERPRAPRMAPAREEYWRNDYADGRDRPRQPYEEYRGPAGRLQPSESRMNESRMQDGRYADGNGRYGERPPRPAAGRPPQEDMRSGDGRRDSQRMPERGPDSFQQRPPERRPERSEGAYNGRPAERSAEGPSERPANRPAARPAAEQPGNGNRALNVRPYSEAPKLDLARDEEGYSDSRNRPGGQPSES